MSYATIYLLTAGPFWKVGITSMGLSMRISHLQTGCPFEIKVFYHNRGPERLVRDLERSVLKSCAPWAVDKGDRRRSEWFRADEENCCLSDLAKQITELLEERAVLVGQAA